VITTDEGDSAAVTHLQSNQELKGLDTIQTSVYEITEEEVVSIG
jgi:hypothetical protein